MSPETIQFIQAHRNDDVRSLALQAARHPQVDMTAAVNQIAGWQTARVKLPAWAAVEGVIYPPHLSMEQCSSQLTAEYKIEVVRNLLATEDAKSTENTEGTASERTSASASEQASASVSEQASTSASEQTSTAEGTSLVDLTAGFGIDCSFLSTLFAHATYVERQEVLCRIARHNFPLMGLRHIEVVNTDGIAHLQHMEPATCIYLDPARRDNQGGKVVAIADCEPNVAALEPTLLAKARHVVVKLSPMLDLTLALNHLRHVRQAHVVSVDNECKELLLVLGHGTPLHPDEVPIYAVNLKSQSHAATVSHATTAFHAPIASHASTASNPPLTSNFSAASHTPAVPGILTATHTPIIYIDKDIDDKDIENKECVFRFTRREEQSAPCLMAAAPGRYLYEPHAALLKAGAYRSVAARYGVAKLHPNSHLYTSDEYLPHFPGRRFEIVGSGGFGKKDIKELKTLLGPEAKANLTVRNFPATVATLRKKLKINEGGDLYLFATTIGRDEHRLVWCRPVTQL